MAVKKAARDSGNYRRAKVSARDADIVSDWEKGCLWAGVAVGLSFALMGIIGGQLGW